MNLIIIWLVITAGFALTLAYRQEDTNPKVVTPNYDGAINMMREDIIKMRTDIQTIFEEQSKRIEVLEHAKPVAQRIVVKHLFPNAVPVNLVYSKKEEAKRMPIAPKSLLDKAGVTKKQMKGL